MMVSLYPILYVDLFRQSSYKNSVLVSMMHKQRTYFSKKYSKINRITLSNVNRLFEVCKKDNIKLVKIMNKKIDIIKYNNFVFRSAGLNNIRIVRYFLNNGYNVGYKNINYFYDLLLYCSLECCCKLVKLLLEKGAEIHANNDYALQVSAGNGHIEVVKLLLEKGANIYANNDYALQLSAKHGYIEVMKLLLEKGANIHADNDCALQWSAENGHIEVVKLLLEKGAHIHANDDYALQWSAYHGHIEVVKLLLEKGANIHAWDNFALQYSACNGHIEIVKLLLEKGANIHAKGDYALQSSARYGRIEVVKLLLEKGANIHVLNTTNIHPNVKVIIKEKLKLEQ